MLVDIKQQPPSLHERFTDVRLIGAGAGGKVYYARDPQMGGHEVAVKVFKADNKFDELARRRFFQEVLVASQVKHPNVINAYDSFYLQEGPAYSMEFIKGTDLLNLSQERLSYEMIDWIMYQLLDGLDALHAMGVVHRDIKPENIMIQEGTRVKLGDFGLQLSIDLERRTKQGTCLGTMQFFAPEYALEWQCDQRSDIYSCGVVLYELLAGTRYMSDIEGYEVIGERIRKNFKFPDFEIPDYGRKYINILNRSLAREPDKRFQSAKAMQDAFLPNERVPDVTDGARLPITFRYPTDILEEHQFFESSRSTDTPEPSKFSDFKTAKSLISTPVFILTALLAALLPICIFLLVK